MFNGQVYDLILIVVNHCTWMSLYIPTIKTIITPALIELLRRRVFNHFSYSDEVVSDWGSLFMSHYYSQLCYWAQIEHWMSTAFHPQMDRQTERQNQTLKQYLWIFCHHQQDDWAEFLSQAEFIINNVFSVSVKELLFYLLHKYYSKCDWVHETKKLLTDSVEVPWADEQTRDLNWLWEGMAVEWKCVSEAQAMAYNCKHQPIIYKVEDHMWLLIRNLD